jgi:hypothetical protein
MTFWHFHKPIFASIARFVLKFTLIASRNGYYTQLKDDFPFLKLEYQIWIVPAGRDEHNLLHFKSSFA